MKNITCLLLMSLCITATAWSQLTVKNSGGNIVMQVDDQARVTIGTTTTPGALTTHTLTILDGAADGRVLKSDATGLASWGTDQVEDDDHVIGNEYQDLVLNGNTLEITDGNSVTLPTGSDNQELTRTGYDLSIDRGNSVTLPDGRPLGGSQITIASDGRTVNHGNTSSQGNVNNSGRTVIQDISVDGNGHVTGINSSTLADATEDNQPLGEVLTDGTNAGGRNAVGFGKIGVGTASPTAKLEVKGQAVTSFPYNYGVPDPATTYTSLFTDGSSASNNHSIYVNESVVQSLSSDNGQIHIATHGAQLIDGDNGVSGSLGYHNTYGNENILAGVMGHVRDKPYTPLKTTAGFFLQDLQSETDYGLWVSGTTVIGKGYHGDTSDWNGLLFFGSDKDVSISRYTGNENLYITNHANNVVVESDYDVVLDAEDDVNMKCDEIRMNGTVVHSSDRRWKTNIHHVEDIVDRVMDLSSVEFTWKEKEDNRTHYGLIAQEVEDVFPNLVSADEQGYKYVNYNELIPILLKVVQDQQREIDALKQP